MQNMGFAFTMMPLVQKLGGKQDEVAAMLTRHLQVFNTNPYMSGPILGSVARLEESSSEGGQCLEADNLKNALMAPYAAIGDSLFWGALKPFAAIVAVICALQGWSFAPLMFLLIYNTIHILVRARGLISGYREGKGGIEFIRTMNLPQWTRRIRWLSVLLLGILAYIVSKTPDFNFIHLDILEKTSVLIIVFLCFWMLKKGISALQILYGASILFILISSLW